MKYIIFRKIYFLLILVFASQSLKLTAQVDSELEDQALLLFSHEEFEMASQLYDSLLRMAPYNPDYSEKLGDCYVKSDFDKALKYYKRSLAMNNDRGEIYYKIASGYDLKNNSDSALFYFRKYNQLNKKNENAYNRMAILFLDQEGGEDSALIYAQKAISVKPDDPNGYYTLSMVYINLSRYEEAIHTARAGVKINADYPLFNMAIGLAYFHQDLYAEAADYFERGWKFDGQEEMFVNYLAVSSILSNAKASKIKKENNVLRFTDINMQNFVSILESTQNPESEYFYSKLLKDFRTNYKNFGLDKFAMLYLGFSNDESYKPYREQTLDADELMETKNYDFLKDYCETRLDSVPVDFPLYWHLAKIAAMHGDYETQLQNLIKYYGFSQAITATGDGNSKDSPYLIAYLTHEYEIVYQLDLDIKEEFIETSRNNNFDVIIGNDPSGKPQKVYFNIDLPYSYHQKSLNISRKNKKRKAK